MYLINALERWLYRIHTATAARISVRNSRAERVSRRPTRSDVVLTLPSPSGPAITLEKGPCVRSQFPAVSLCRDLEERALTRDSRQNELSPEPKSG